MTENSKRILVYLDGAETPLAKLEGSAGDFSLDTTGIPDGTHRLRFVTMTGDRVTGEREVAFTVRNGPGIAVAGLEDHDEVRGRLALKVGATDAAVGARLDIPSLELHRGLPFWMGGFALAVVILLAFILATEPLRFNAYQNQAAAVRSATAPAAPVDPGAPSPPDPMRIALLPGSFLPVLDFDSTKADATHGAALYAQYCAGCHGDRGQGHAGQSATLGEQGIYPRLAGQPAAYAYRQLYSFAKGWRHNDVMQAIASGLDPRDWGDLAVYLEGLRGTPYLPAPPIGADMRAVAHSIVTLGRPERGITRCESCHGPDGIGVAPYFPALSGQDAHYLAAQIEDFRAGRRRNSMLRLMEPVAHGLTPRETEALSLYFQSRGSGGSN